MYMYYNLIKYKENVRNLDVEIVENLSATKYRQIIINDSNNLFGPWTKQTFGLFGSCYSSMGTVWLLMLTILKVYSQAYSYIEAVLKQLIMSTCWYTQNDKVHC